MFYSFAVWSKDKTTVYYCSYNVDTMLISNALDLRRLKLLCDQSTSTNSVVQILYDINDLMVLKNIKHCVTNIVYTTAAVFRNCIWSHFPATCGVADVNMSCVFLNSEQCDFCLLYTSPSPRDS